MTINADTLLDRLYLKSQLNKWRVLAVLFAVAALVIVIDHQSMRSPIEAPFIARLRVEGFIGDNQDFYDRVDDLANNAKAKAVIVWLDTPGGSAVGGEEMFLKLRELAAKKPVVAVMRSVAASAGYMIALGADYIVAREGTITGSIGVIIESAEVTELAQKIGVQPIVVKSAPLKSTLSPVEKATPESLRSVQDVVDDFYARFVEMVAERRQLPRETVASLADGRIYSGRRAVEHKLVDAIGGEEEAVAWLEDKRQVARGLEIKEIEKEEKLDDLLSRLTESAAGVFYQKTRGGLDGIRAIWHPAL